MARDGACSRRHGQGAPLSTVVVIARAPHPGRSKTRLCPPCTPEQAAGLAEAALEDTLKAVAGTAADRRVLALDGSPGRWLPRGFEIIAQRGEGLGERLAAAVADTGTPALIIGMDTPQVTARDLHHALDLLESPRIDAVLGPAHDGGYWAIGLCSADPRAFSGVPMSTARTAEAQLAQLHRLGLATQLLPELRDVDYFEDACAVSAQCSGSRFQQEFERVLLSLSPTRGTTCG